MTGTSLTEMLDERRHLLDTASWMFAPAIADRVVRETYRRWYALGDDERAAIAVPRAWLTRVAGSICLELLAAPERGFPAVPVRPKSGPDPVAAWLRRHPSRDYSDAALLVRRFAAACESGDPAILTRLLAADAMVVSDGGGKVRAAPHPTHGAGAAAHFITTLLAGRPGTVLTVESVNGRTGLVLRRTGRAVAVVSVSVAEAAVTAVWIILNPDKLKPWHRP